MIAFSYIFEKPLSRPSLDHPNDTIRYPKMRGISRDTSNTRVSVLDYYTGVRRSQNISCLYYANKKKNSLPSIVANELST